MQNKLKKKVKLITENIKEIKSKDFFNEYNEDIFILENIRFYSEEEQNDNKFAEHLSDLGDIYVNDAFLVRIELTPQFMKFQNSYPRFLGCS